MESRQLRIAACHHGRDILGALSERIINESKLTLRRLIAEGHIRVNGNAVGPRSRVWEGDEISVPPELDLGPPPGGPLVIDVLREERDHLAVNKPAGYPVLAARDGDERQFYNSLVAWLNRDAPEGGPYVRAHPVHRLDRGTSGVLLVAKDERTGRNLSLQFQRRKVRKSYLAIVEGVLPRRQVTVDIPLARASSSGFKMAADDRSGKPAVSRIELERAFGHFSLVRVTPLTGRQHQVRVHLAAIGYPLAVDFMYGRRDQLTGEAFNAIVGRAAVHPARVLMARSTLHAESISYHSPSTGERQEVSAPLPADMASLLELLAEKDPPPS